MTYFRNIVSKLFTNGIMEAKDNLILGRWSMNYSKDYLDRKIYLANHDHCGPCGSLSELPGVNKTSNNKI
mgnify:CR=1 FL=1